MNGPNEKKENKISTITEALNNRFHVEVDLWRIEDRWYFGHNEPTEYVSDEDWITFYPSQHMIWFHCKNIKAMRILKDIKWEGHYFWHENDAVTMTSTGYLWTHFSFNKLTPHSIMLMPEFTNSLDNCLRANCYGICTDYVKKLRQSIR